MKCPICGTWTTVKSTRESKEFGHMRRRECGNEHKFSTTEVLIPQEKIDAFLDAQRKSFGKRTGQGG
jgi:transcriptional regulator NrdR family protein